MAEWIAEGLAVIDLKEDGLSYRTSGYVLTGAEPVLIETGSSQSFSDVEKELEMLGLKPSDLRHIIVTHVHLDHAGGAGLWMQKAPRAVLHCHPRAAQHMIDPSRLKQGALAVYGEQQLQQMYGEIYSTDATRVVAHPDGDVLEVNGRTLTFYDTPGHAKHHFCIMDDKTQGLFSGDTVGLRFRGEFTGWPMVYGMPTTSPSDFNPVVMRETLSRLESFSPSRIFHTHFGVTEPAEDAFQFCYHGLDLIDDLIAKLSDKPTFDEIHEQLQAMIREDAGAQGNTGGDFSGLALDLNLNAQGILVYLQKKAQGKL